MDDNTHGDEGGDRHWSGALENTLEKAQEVSTRRRYDDQCFAGIA